MIFFSQNRASDINNSTTDFDSVRRYIKYIMLNFCKFCQSFRSQPKFGIRTAAPDSAS